MSDYILREIRKALDRPTREEILRATESAAGPSARAPRRRGHPRRARRAMIVLDASALLELLLGTEPGA